MLHCSTMGKEPLCWGKTNKMCLIGLEWRDPSQRLDSSFWLVKFLVSFYCLYWTLVCFRRNLKHQDCLTLMASLLGFFKNKISIGISLMEFILIVYINNFCTGWVNMKISQSISLVSINSCSAWHLVSSFIKLVSSLGSRNSYPVQWYDLIFINFIQFLEHILITHLYKYNPKV